ncbi:S-methyl-5-thioribose kinase [Brucella sp. LJL56]
MTDRTITTTAIAFNEHTLKAYLGSTPRLNAVFDEAVEDLLVDEIGDGNLNFVFFVRGEKAALALKQALPYSRMSGGSRSLTCERLAFETKALRIFAQLAPDHVPVVHHYDAEKSLMAQEFLSPHIIMRKGMVDGVVYPHFADHISTYLARCLYGTSDFALDATRKRELVADFARNIELCEITERLIFTEPFVRSTNNRWTSPALDAHVERIQSDTVLKLRVAELKQKFLTRTDALLHADLHSGSIMLTERDTKVIDPEFAVFGPMGFDIGILIGNLLLNYFAQSVYELSGGDRTGYRQHILAMVQDVWSGFVSKFSLLCQEPSDAGIFSSSAYDPSIEGMSQARDAFVHSYLDEVLRDTIGYAAVEMIRRTIGPAHTLDYELITDQALRAKSEAVVLACATGMLARPFSIRTINDVCCFGQECEAL